MTREEKKDFERKKEKELLKTQTEEEVFEHTIDDLDDMPPVFADEYLEELPDDSLKNIGIGTTIQIKPKEEMFEGTKQIVEEPEISKTITKDVTKFSIESDFLVKEPIVIPDKPKQMKMEEHNHIYINTIWDATLSASQIFKPLYRAYEAGIREIQMLQNEYKNIVVKYGLTYLNTDVRTVQYQNGTSFTEDAEEFLQSIRHMKFAGGSLDGIENFNDAIESGIRTIADESEEHASRGIIYFTDSMTKNESPDFLELENYPSNKKFRFVVGFANSNRYHVKCHVADANGNVTANSRNEGTVSMSMRDLFELGGIETITGMIHDIMNQVSVYV